MTQLSALTRPYSENTRHSRKSAPGTMKPRIPAQPVAPENVRGEALAVVHEGVARNKADEHHRHAELHRRAAFGKVGGDKPHEEIRQARIGDEKMRVEKADLRQQKEAEEHGEPLPVPVDAPDGGKERRRGEIEKSR